ENAVNPAGSGTKAAPLFRRTIGAGETAELRLRLTSLPDISAPLGTAFDATFESRRMEADDFYRRVTPFELPEDMRNVQRQAFAGMLWNKQHYHYSVHRWLDGDPVGTPPPEARQQGRNHDWPHFAASDILSMPDKWEDPWFGALDHAVHV